MTLGERIQEIRLKNRLSQEDFGEMLGTTRQSVSKWERDASLPELEKIVRMAELFSVTTDYILRDGVDTFVPAGEFRCRVMRGPDSEIVITEKFALHFYHRNSCIGCRMYKGSRVLKICVSAAEYNTETDATSAAGMYENGELWQYGENTALREMVGGEFPEKIASGLSVTESFVSVPADCKIPTVTEAGIAGALRTWRMGAEYKNGSGMCSLHLCTAETEYIYSIRPDYEDIYIGASWNYPFEMGLFAGQQYFRIRDHRERADYCGFCWDFTASHKKIKIPTEYAALGQCVSTPTGLMWCVKRYCDDEIVLEGCGGDEYIFRKDTALSERYIAVR